MTGRAPIDQGTKTTKPQHAPILRCLAITCLTISLVMSLLPHKEVRFIYPLLPPLFILAAPSASAFFAYRSTFRTIILTLTITTNLTLAIYFSTFHGRGVIAAQSFLRSEHERHNPGMVTYGQMTDINTTTVAFLMPCHSVPWRSNLVYSGIEAWALTCEPPLALTEAEKETYVDEADQFYADPVLWMRREFVEGGREWPGYLVFFGQLEGTLKEVAMEYEGYEEVWRGFNSFVHDDWRRVGDVIVWGRTKTFEESRRGKS